MGRWSGKKVAVLYGGRSAEREVSLATGKACADALRARGLDVTLVDAGLDLAERLRAMGADVAFLALHGRFGEDGCAQGLLESMGIPYTGSGVLASAMGMDKVVSKLVFRDAGLALAPYRVFPRARAASVTLADLPFGLPAVVKPACEGSSVGVHVVKEAARLAPALADAATFKGDVIVEGYVRGQEVNVAVLDGEALGTVEMVPSREFYDYVAKYTPGSTTYHVPARLSPEATARVSRDAETAYRALGCEGAARVDFIVTPDGTPHILEVNTLPGMTGTSLVPKIAAGRGIPFPELCERLLDGASLKA
ncbi:MAG TPA: D-alanine--D-alanine ligase [Anaeromyxobacteraceae bacterium]|nr:D-alanine--D-alanine ligase [Anaeromyxobacteraceae bacterium]